MNRKITIQNIRDKSPCYNPDKFLPQDWKGRLSDILKIKECPAIDRLWVVRQWQTKKVSVQFAIACAERCLPNFEKVMGDNGPRKAIEAAKAYLKNPSMRTKQAARSAARSAYSARSVYSAARSVYSAARSAYSAARSAADSADSADSAARSAARSAADSAADSVYSAADSAARSAYSAAREKQCEMLYEILTKGEKV